MPDETVVETPKEDIVDIAQFLGEPAEVVTATPTATTPEAPLGADTKPLDKVEPTVPPPVKAVEPIIPPEPKLTKPSRDFTGIDEADQPLFKAMSNEAYEKMKTVYLDRKAKIEEAEKYKKEVEAAKTATPKSWMEHPEAYVLADDYKEADSTAKQAKSELSYWETQYEKISKGEDWEDLDIKDGKLVRVPRQATTRSSVEVLGYIQEARRIARESESKMDQIKGSFVATHQSINSKIEEAENQFFPTMKDYNALVSTNQYAKVMADALKGIGQSNTPLSRVVVKLYTALMAERVARIKEESPKQPNSAAMAPSAPSKPANFVSIDDFKRELSA